jgi:hypothetical protein
VLTVPIAAIDVAVIDAARITIITLFVTKAPRILGHAILIRTPHDTQDPQREHEKQTRYPAHKNLPS